MYKVQQFIFKPLQTLLGKNQGDTIQRFIAKTAAGGIGLKIINVGLVYTMNLLLARFLGAAGYGSYAYAIAWLNLLIIPAVLGLEGLTTREVAVYHSQSKWGLMHGLLRWSNQVVILTSIILALVSTLVIWLWIPTSNSMGPLFVIAMISLPFMALARLRQSAMNALKRIILGYLPESLIRPTLIIILLVGSYFAFEGNLSVSWVMGIYTIASGVAFLVGNNLLEKALPQPCQQAPLEYQAKVWLRSALPMLFIGGMYIINNQTDTIMLGVMKDTEAVGLYSVANRIAAMISFVVVAFNTSLGSTFASLHAEGNKRKLQQIVTQGCRMVFLAAFPMFLIFTVFGSGFLSLFGSDFIQGKTTLIILCLGQLVNTFTGSVALLLLMTGHEKDTAIGVTTSAVLNIFLNIILIPEWGVEGAATATASSMALWNLILAIFAYQRLGINSTIFLENLGGNKK